MQNENNERRWTLTSAECYINKMNCTFCNNFGVICHKLAPKYPFQKPPMKKTCLALYRKFGKPPQDLIEKLQNIA